MLDRRRDDMRTLEPSNRSEYRVIVRFRTAASKDDFLRLTTDQRNRPAGGFLERLLSRLPLMMDTGSVAEAVTQRSIENLEHFLSYRRCRIVIEVERAHLLLQFSNLRMQKPHRHADNRLRNQRSFRRSDERRDPRHLSRRDNRRYQP